MQYMSEKGVALETSMKIQSNPNNFCKWIDYLLLSYTFKGLFVNYGINLFLYNFKQGTTFFKIEANYLFFFKFGIIFCKLHVSGI